MSRRYNETHTWNTFSSQQGGDKEYTEDAWGSSVTDLNNTSVSIGTHHERNKKVKHKEEIPEW